MKLQFDANLEYQEKTVYSIVNLFKGHTPKLSNFTVSLYNKDDAQEMLFSATGIGNKLELDDEDILDNLKEIQLRNGLKQSASIERGKRNFDVEMETGTGKTRLSVKPLLLGKAVTYRKIYREIVLDMRDIS